MDIEKLEYNEYKRRRSMNVLNVLEDKINGLLKKIKELELEKKELLIENQELAGKLEKIETSMLSDIKRIEELDQEKELTKMVVDDLIKSIDSMVVSGQSHE